MPRQSFFLFGPRQVGKTTLLRRIGEGDLLLFVDLPDPDEQPACNKYPNLLANLLGGRALGLTMHPLTMLELGKSFEPERVLMYGSLPPVYSTLVEDKEEAARSLLRSYVTTYVREEIKAETLVRNLQGFQNFLDVAAGQFARQVNFSAISRECSVA